MGVYLTETMSFISAFLGTKWKAQNLLNTPDDKRYIDWHIKLGHLWYAKQNL